MPKDRKILVKNGIALYSRRSLVKRQGIVPGVVTQDRLKAVFHLQTIARIATQESQTAALTIGTEIERGAILQPGRLRFDFRSKRVVE